MLYTVRIGQDVYVGTAAEVVAFMARGEGAPGRSVGEYMEATAARVAEQLGEERIDPASETAFLESLAATGVLDVKRQAEPSAQRVDPRDALGEGPVALGPGVEPGDVDY